MRSQDAVGQTEERGFMPTIMGRLLSGANLGECHLSKLLSPAIRLFFTSRVACVFSNPCLAARALESRWRKQGRVHPRGVFSKTVFEKLSIARRTGL